METKHLLMGGGSLITIIVIVVIIFFLMKSKPVEVTTHTQDKTIKSTSDGKVKAVKGGVTRQVGGVSTHIEGTTTHIDSNGSTTTHAAGTTVHQGGVTAHSGNSTTHVGGTTTHIAPTGKVTHHVNGQVNHTGGTTTHTGGVVTHTGGTPSTPVETHVTSGGTVKHVGGVTVHTTSSGKTTIKKDGVTTHTGGTTTHTGGTTIIKDGVVTHTGGITTHTGGTTTHTSPEGHAVVSSNSVTTHAGGTVTRTPVVTPIVPAAKTYPCSFTAGTYGKNDVIACKCLQENSTSLEANKCVNKHFGACAGQAIQGNPQCTMCGANQTLCGEMTKTFNYLSAAGLNPFNKPITAKTGDPCSFIAGTYGKNDVATCKCLQENSTSLKLARGCVNKTFGDCTAQAIQLPADCRGCGANQTLCGEMTKTFNRLSISGLNPFNKYKK